MSCALATEAQHAAARAAGIILPIGNTKWNDLVMNSSLECIALLQHSKAALMMLSEDPPQTKGHSECLPTATALPL
jgi:hypothetical protein